MVNEVGKEAVVAILGPGDFFGEGCLAGQSICMATATEVAPTTVLVIEKNEMIRVLHGEHEFSDRFIAYMLARNLRVEGDLIDQLFNSTEKRLARTLLLLARSPSSVLHVVSLPGSVVCCIQVLRAQNHAETGSFPRLRRLRRKEFPAVLDVDKSPSDQQSERCGGKPYYQQ